MAIATTTALALAAIAATAAGTGVAVAGQMQQAKAQEKTAKYNAAVAENTALAQQQQAQYEASRIERRNRLLAGKQRAVIAKSGINISDAEDVIYDSELQGELDRMAALYSGNVASGYYQSRATLTRLEGANAATASRYQAAGTLLSGTGRAASQSAPLFED